MSNLTATLMNSLQTFDEKVPEESRHLAVTANDNRQTTDGQLVATDVTNVAFGRIRHHL